jgi:hypothetical protein
VSGLWTPYGEHRPEPDEGRDAPRAGTAAEDDALRDTATAEPADESAVAEQADESAVAEQADEAEMREALVRLAQTPVADIVANHAIGLWQLAVLHLGLGGEAPPDLAQASLAIDAMGGLVDGLGDRLGEHAVPLRDAVAQLRLAFVQVSQAVQQSEPPAS